MSIFAQIKGGSIYYISSNFVQKAFAFAILPVLTSYLAPSEYGIISLVSALGGVVMLFMMLALQAAVTRFFFEFKDNQEALKRFLGSIIVFVNISSLCLGVMLLTFGESLIAVFIGDIDFYPYIVLGLLFAIFQPMFTILLSMLQVMQRAKEYAFAFLLNYTASAILGLGVIVFFEYKAEGMLFSSFVVALISNILSFWYMRKSFTLCFDLLHIRRALSYSIPLIPNSLFSQINAVADKVIVNVLIGTTATGIYSLGFMIGSVIQAVAVSINRAYVPVAMASLKSNNPSEFRALAKMGEIIVYGYCYAALGLSLFSKELILLFIDDAYFSAANVVPLIAFSFVLLGIYYLFVNILFFDLGKAKYIAFFTGASMGLNIVLNYIFVPRYGIEGAAVATFGTQFLITLLVAVFAGRIDKIRWAYSKIAFMFSICFATSVFVAKSSHEAGWSLIVIKIVILFGLYLLLNRVVFGVYIDPRQAIRNVRAGSV
jgi:O-antigen/teichoic acid export membrane protein